MRLRPLRKTDPDYWLQRDRKPSKLRPVFWALVVVGALLASHYVIGVLVIVFWLLVAVGLVWLAIALFGSDKNEH